MRLVTTAILNTSEIVLIEKGRSQVATYNIKVMVEFNYEVEADTEEMAEAQGWKWEDHIHSSSVDSIEVDELQDPEEEIQDPEEDE